MRRIISGMAAALALLAGAAAHAQGDNEQRQQALRALEASLHPRQGAIDISQAKARLDLGQRYDFLGPEDAKRVLTEGWGNPPESVSDVLGLVYPHGSSLFVKEAWAAVITYEQTFYVSDKDVAKSDYDKLLSDMKSGEDKENSERQKAGFAPVHLVGWAQPPAYDRARHNLIWARDIKFDGQDVDTLNYDMRHLGRHGVLSVNIVAGMDQLADIRTAANDLAPTAEFLPGERYADHEASDKAAGYRQERLGDHRRRGRGGVELAATAVRRKGEVDVRPVADRRGRKQRCGRHGPKRLDGHAAGLKPAAVSRLAPPLGVTDLDAVVVAPFGAADLHRMAAVVAMVAAVPVVARLSGGRDGDGQGAGGHDAGQDKIQGFHL